MNIFRKKSLIEDVEPVFHVYRTPDSEVVGHPARTGHVLGILSSIAMRNERIDYTIHLGMVRYHRDLRMSAHKDVEQGRLEELLTPEGQSFPYIAFSVAQTAHFGLLPPYTHQEQWKKQYRRNEEVVRLGCQGLVAIAAEYPTLSQQNPDQGLRIPNDIINAMKENVVGENPGQLIEYVE